MNRDDQNRNAKGTGTGPARTGRELEQDRNEPLGDRGQGDKTWTPPAGEQGLSNRADDDDADQEQNEDDATDNQGQKTVQGKSQQGPDSKVGRSAGGNEGSKGQNSRGGQGGPREGGGNEERSQSGKAGPNRGGGSGSGEDTRQNKNAGENENAKRFNRPGSQAEQGNKGKAK